MVKSETVSIWYGLGYHISPWSVRTNVQCNAHCVMCMATARCNGWREVVNGWSKCILLVPAVPWIWFTRLLGKDERGRHWYNICSHCTATQHTALHKNFTWCVFTQPPWYVFTHYHLDMCSLFSEHCWHTTTQPTRFNTMQTLQDISSVLETAIDFNCALNYISISLVTSNNV